MRPADKLQEKAAKFLPLVGLARSKQDPINRGHGAQYLYRPPPAGARRCFALKKLLQKFLIPSKYVPNCALRSAYGLAMFAALQPWHCSILLLSSDENKAGPDYSDYSTSQQEWAEQCLATACMMSARSLRVEGV